MASDPVLTVPSPSLGRSQALGQSIQGGLESSTIASVSPIFLPPWTTNLKTVRPAIEAGIDATDESVTVEDR